MANAIYNFSFKIFKNIHLNNISVDGKNTTEIKSKCLYFDIPIVTYFIRHNYILCFNFLIKHNILVLIPSNY